MNKQTLLAATLGASMLVPALANAQTDSMSSTTGNPPAAALSSTDSDFVMKAAQGGMTEVQTSKLADKTSSNNDVKSFADHMIKDHKKANSDLKKIAKSLNVSLPKKLDAPHQAEMDQLNAATGADFDQKFIAVQDKEHNDAVTAFQKEADNGDNAQLKAFANKDTARTARTHEGSEGSGGQGSTGGDQQHVEVSFDRLNKGSLG